MLKISKIILYDDPKHPEIKIDKLEEFLSKNFKTNILRRENFFEIVDQNILDEIKKVRVYDLKKPFSKQEKNILENQEFEMFDGFEIIKIISKFIPPDENRMDIFHVIFTDRLIGTFDESDFRYHARIIIGSNPTIISIPGMIEAPAKPKQYYLDLMTNVENQSIEKINEKYKGGFLEEHDPRLNDVAEGCLLQAIVYYETGEEFCEDKSCRLFNSHWQKDLISTQVESKKLCQKHLQILKNLTNQS